MPEQAQKKISKEAARMIFEAVLTQQYFRLEGPLTMSARAMSVLLDLDDLVEDGGQDVVGLFLRQTDSKSLVDGEDVERIQPRKTGDTLGNLDGTDLLDTLLARTLDAPTDSVSDLFKDLLSVKRARERKANLTGLNGRHDDSNRIVLVQGNAFFF